MSHYETRGDHNATCGYRHFICIECSQTYQLQDENKHMPVRLRVSTVLLHTLADSLSLCLHASLSALCCRSKPHRFLSALLTCSSSTDEQTASRDEQTASTDEQTASRDEQTASRDEQTASTDEHTVSRDEQTASACDIW